MNAGMTGLAEALTEYVRPGSFPVAVRMVKKGEALPARLKRPWQDLHNRVATCQAMAIARRYGWVLAVGREDLSCPLSAVVFGFRPKSEYYHQGRACAGMYTETTEAGIRAEAGVATFSEGEYEYILVAPLQRTAFEPDVIVVYGNPAQVLRLLSAALWKSGGRLTSSFGGRIDCSEEIIVPMRTGRCEVILPCHGDRIFAQTQDHEMAFSIPRDRAAEIVAGLAGTHKGGLRYPMPSFLRYTGTFPPQYANVAE
ncbi:MAG TPA: DUF169 domain-containing protein [Syntrophobacteria bacterium]|nr:DUF169 domain-containing protein [Syntrophobacteria bacterium]